LLLNFYDKFSFYYCRLYISDSKAISSNGIFRPTIVANGQVVGLLGKSNTKNKSVTLSFFEQSDILTDNETNKAINIFNTFLGR
jgi:hypothetical protein